MEALVCAREVKLHTPAYAGVFFSAFAAPSRRRSGLLALNIFTKIPMDSTLASFAQDCVCLRSHHFVVCWLRDIDTIDVKLETCLPPLTIWRQIRKTMHLTSVLQGYLIWRHIIIAVHRTQTAIFFNFLGHKNEVYRKLKPLQEKVKYTFFSKLYYRVSRKKKSAQKINPAIDMEGSKRGHFLTIKMVFT